MGHIGPLLFCGSDVESSGGYNVESLGGYNTGRRKLRGYNVESSGGLQHRTMQVDGQMGEQVNGHMGDLCLLPIS